MPRRPVAMKLKPPSRSVTGPNLRELGLAGERQDSALKQLAGLGATQVIRRILPVVAHAVAVFGDEHKASHWLETPLSILGDRAPAQVLVGKGGVDAVERVLTRIEHNIPS